MAIIRDEIEGEVIIESIIKFKLVTAQDYLRFEWVTTIDKNSELVTHFEELCDSLQAHFANNPHVISNDLFGQVDIYETRNGECIGQICNSITVGENTDNDEINSYHHTLDYLFREQVITFVTDSMENFKNYGIRGERQRSVVN